MSRQKFSIKEFLGKKVFFPAVCRSHRSLDRIEPRLSRALGQGVASAGFLFMCRELNSVQTSLYAVRAALSMRIQRRNRRGKSSRPFSKSRSKLLKLRVQSGAERQSSEIIHQSRPFFRFCPFEDHVERLYICRRYTYGILQAV